jgi:hypothetical protein
MARKRYTKEQIIGLPREAEVRLAQGQAIGTICKQLAVVLRRGQEPMAPPDRCLEMHPDARSRLPQADAVGQSTRIVEP